MATSHTGGQTEVVDDSIVTTAEQEAAEAEDLAAALAERVRDGDDVEPAELANAEQLGRFARLRVEAARRKVERAKTAARLADCKALCEEIESYASGTGERFAELLATAETAIRAFVAAVDERNQHIAVWRQRMHNLQVPAHGNPLVPPKEHGRLGWTEHDGQVIGGRRRMMQTSPERWLNSMLCHVTLDMPVKHFNSVVMGGAQPRDELYDQLASLDAPAADAPTNLVFYRGENGAIHSYDPDLVPPPEDLKRLKMTRVSREEAWGK